MLPVWVLSEGLEWQETPHTQSYDKKGKIRGGLERKVQVHKDICWVEEPQIKIPYTHTTINQPGKQLTNHITPHKEKTWKAYTAE